MRPSGMRLSGALRTAAMLAASVEAAQAANESKGMPQLDFNNPMTVSQVVWLGFIFVGFYFLLSKWALPKVADVLQLRATTVAQDLDAARAAKAKADAAVAELTDTTKAAQAEAQTAIAEALARAKSEAAEQAAAVSAKLDAQIDEAEQRIASARQAGLGAVKQVATDAATAMMERLSGVSPLQSAIESAVDAALSARALPVG